MIVVTLNKQTYVNISDSFELSIVRQLFCPRFLTVGEHGRSGLIWTAAHRPEVLAEKRIKKIQNYQNGHCHVRGKFLQTEDLSEIDL